MMAKNFFSRERLQQLKGTALGALSSVFGKAVKVGKNTLDKRVHDRLVADHHRQVVAISKHQANAIAAELVRSLRIAVAPPKKTNPLLKGIRILPAMAAGGLLVGSLVLEEDPMSTLKYAWCMAQEPLGIQSTAEACEPSELIKNLFGTSGTPQDSPPTDKYAPYPGQTPQPLRPTPE